MSVPVSPCFEDAVRCGADLVIDELQLGERDVDLTNFQSWFTGLLDELAQLRASVLDAIVHELGIPPELRDRIPLVPLG